MYTPKINIYGSTVNVCGCGSNLPVDSCTCSQSQSASAIQSLPAKALPCSDPTVCSDPVSTDCVLWPGPDIPSRGIKKGDPMTKIINLIFQTLP